MMWLGTWLELGVGWLCEICAASQAWLPNDVRVANQLAMTADQ